MTPSILAKERDDWKDRAWSILEQKKALEWSVRNRERAIDEIAAELEQAHRDLAGQFKQTRREINLKRELRFNADRWRAARHVGLLGRLRKACGR